LKLIVNRKRVAVSELLGTLIMVAITLVAGAAVFGWINGQAGTSENAYGASVANNVNFLKERFVPVTQTFSASPSGGACSTVGGTNPHYYCNLLSFWVYNAGQITFRMYTVKIQNLTDIPSGLGACSTAGGCPLNILFFAGSTTSCATANPQNCGFIVYNKAGTAAVCTDAAAWATTGLSPYQPGFYQNGAVPASLAQGQLTANPYQITMPTTSSCAAGGNQYLYDGLAYTLTFTGLYGNTFTTTVTVNG
jgi:flagellin-like protein